ncbi:MAG: outer membrane usher protein [Janthinobacterium sp.]|jgi:outer membrane usher protein
MSRTGLRREPVFPALHAPAFVQGFALAMLLLSESARAEPASQLLAQEGVAIVGPAADKGKTVDDNKKRRQRKPVADVLLLDVSINDQPLADVVMVEQMPGGPLLLPLDAWSAARLLPLAQTGLSMQSDGTPAYALDAVAGATWNIDRRTMRIDIHAPAGAFIASAFGAPDAVALAPPRPQPGFMLDYDLLLSRSAGGGASSGGAMLEAVAFSGLGNIVTSVLTSSTDRSVTRLDTYWRYDMPNRMESLTVGDTIGTAGSWSRPARYGGVRWGRDFAMRPGFVTLPQMSLAGAAALPSTADVLVNNVRRLSQKVEPGPFDLNNVPIVTGAGEFALVVRDLLGRETVVRQSFYASPRLLVPGLSDFSFEAGRLRTGYGSSNAYGAPFGAATWRQGVSRSVTGEARIEWQDQRRAAGIDVTSLLGTWAVGRVALAASGGAQGSGHLTQVGIERSTPKGGAALQYEHASSGFAPFGAASGAATAAAAANSMAQRTRDRWLVSVGGALWGAIGGGANYVRQTRWDGDLLQAVGLSLNLSLWGRANVSVALSKRLDIERSLSAAITLSLPLDGGVVTSSQVSRDGTGKLSGSVSAAGTAPSGPGLAWQVQAGSAKSQRAQGSLRYNTSAAEWSLQGATSGGGQIATSISGRGTVGWLDGMAFASRPVGTSSVAVIKVDGIEGVAVRRNYQVVAVTDARGMAFVPGLLSWQKNNISIDMLDLPLDVEVTSSSADLTPFSRSGMVLDFGAKRSRQALLVLHRTGGAPVPIGARVRLLPGGPEFIAGRRGEVWLTGLAASRQQVRVSWSGGGCLLALEVPVSVDGAPGKIGPLVCGEKK